MTGHPTLFSAILKATSSSPQGISPGDLANLLGDQVQTRRTLQRHLRKMVEEGLLVASGGGRGRRYHLPRQEPLAKSAEPLPLSQAALEIKHHVNRSLAERTPVGYRPEFLQAYEPGVTFYLPHATRVELASMGAVGIENLPAGTYLRQLMDRLLIDLSWNSSRLEGNTYSLLETQRLLELGEPSQGKPTTETTMILNHKAAIEMLADPVGEARFDRHTLCNLHALLSDNLLSDPAACGRLRRRPVGITGTVFHPIDNPHELEAHFNELIRKGAAIEDPFELAFFVMVHLPYLQPFEDVNKHVSRLAANVPLMRHNLCPLSFVDVPQDDYVSGLLGVYELNRTELLAELFVWAYRRSAARYSAIRQSLGDPDPYRLRYRAAIHSVVQEVVQEHLTKPEAIERIRARSAQAIPPEDQPRFVEIVETELMNLHDGSIARYRLRLSEFTTWQATW